MNKFFLIFLFLILIVTVLPSDSPILFVLCITHIFALTIYANLKYSTFYIFCQNRSYVNSKGTEVVILFTSHFVNAFIFLLISMILVSCIINFITPFTLQNLLNTPWLYGVCFLISGVSYISIFGYLNKVSHRYNDHSSEGSE